MRYGSKTHPHRREFCLADRGDCVMGPEGAVDIVYKRELSNAPEAGRAALRKEKIAEFRNRFRIPSWPLKRGYTTPYRTRRNPRPHHHLPARPRKPSATPTQKEAHRSKHASLADTTFPAHAELGCWHAFFFGVVSRLFSRAADEVDDVGAGSGGFDYGVDVAPRSAATKDSRKRLRNSAIFSLRRAARPARAHS